MRDEKDLPHVLVVECFPTLFTEITENLGQMLGCGVDCYASFANAINFAQLRQIHKTVVLGTSVNDTYETIMPKVRAVKEALPAVKKIVLFAATDLNEPHSFGVDAIAKKPYLSELAEAVRPFLSCAV